MKLTKRFTSIALFAVILVLPTLATITQAQTVETGTVKLADSNIEYFSRGQGEPIVLLPGGTLTVSYLDGLADALAKSGYRIVGINFRVSGKSTGASKGAFWSRGGHTVGCGLDWQVNCSMVGHYAKAGNRSLLE